MIAGLAYLALFTYFAYETLTQSPPQITNNIPGVQVSYVPPPVLTSLLRAAIIALVRWPLVVLIVFLGYICLDFLIQRIRTAIFMFR